MTAADLRKDLCVDAEAVGDQDENLSEFALIRKQRLSAGEFLTNVWRKGVDALKQSGSERIPLDRKAIALEMQKAALAFTLIRTDLNKNGADYKKILELANGGGDYVKNRLLEEISSGGIKDLDANTVNAWDLGKAIKPKESFDRFLKNTKIGSDVRRRDNDLDYTLENKYEALERIHAVQKGEKVFVKGVQLFLGSDEDIRNDIKGANDELTALKEERKKELREAYEQGLITKYYYENRTQQLDNVHEGNYREELSSANRIPMFRADNATKFDDFIKDTQKKTGVKLSVTSKDFDAKYEMYVAEAQQERRDFFVNKYISMVEPAPEKVVVQEKPVENVQKDEFADLPEEPISDKYARLKANASMQDLYRQNPSVLDRYLLAKKPEDVVVDSDFDELKYLQAQKETPKEVADRLWNTSIEALQRVKPNAQLGVELTPGIIANAVINAASKYLAIHPELDEKTEGVKELREFAYDGVHEFRTKVQNEMKAGRIKGVNNEVIEKWDVPYTSTISNTAERYHKETREQGYGKYILDLDANINRELSEKLAKLQERRLALSTTTSDLMKAPLQSSINNLEKEIEVAVEKRKLEMSRYAVGTITEKYHNARIKQLDDRDFASPLPKMFEADEPLSKQDYLKRDHENEKLSEEEADKLYRTYLRDVQREKQAFIAKAYLYERHIYDRSHPSAISQNGEQNVAVEPQVKEEANRQASGVQRKVTISGGEFVGDVNNLDRFFLAGNAKDVKTNPNLDEVQWIKDLNVNPVAFETRLRITGERAILNADEKSGVTRAEVVAAIQMAAVKYLAVHSGEEMDQDTRSGLKEIAENAPETFKTMILKDIKNWEIRDVDEKTASGWDLGAGVSLKEDFDSFKNSDKIENFGQDVVEADNYFYAQLDKIPGNEERKARCQERKAQLADALKQGKITEYYFNKRAEQLDSGKNVDVFSIPPMFESDEIEDIETFAEKHGLDLDKNYIQTQEAYGKYNNALKEEKSIFIAKRYWEEEGFNRPDYLTWKMSGAPEALEEKADNKNVINEPEEVKKPAVEKPVEQKPVEEIKQEVFESEADIVRRLKKEQGIDDEELSFVERVKDLERRKAARRQRELEEAQAEKRDDESDVDEDDIEPININDLASDKDMLARYFLAPKPKFFNADPDLDEAQWIRDNDERFSTFFYRAWKAGVQALKDVDANKDSTLKHSDIAAAMQMAAIKYILATPDINKDDEDYELLSKLADKGPEFIKERILSNIDEGYINDLDKETVQGWDLGASIAPKESYDKYYEREEDKYGDDVRDVEFDLKDKFEELLSDKPIEADDDDDELEEDEKPEKRKPLTADEKKAAINQLIEERKVQLAEALKQGKITEFFYNKRIEQFAEPEKLGEAKVPYMFEADNALDWNAYIESEEIAGKQLSDEEKDEAYDAYKDRIKLEKESFFKDRYVKETGLDQKDYLSKKLGVSKGSKRISVDLREDEKANEPAVNEKEKQDIRLSRVSSVEEKGKQDAKSTRSSARRSKPVCIIIDEEQEDELDEMVKEAQKKADEALNKGNRVSVDIDDDVSVADNKQFIKVEKDVNLNKDDLKK